MALDLRVLLEMGKHDDQWNFFLVNHTPEVLDCRLKRSLSGDKKLIVWTDRRINVIRVDVRVVDVLIALDQTNARVLN